VDPSQSVTARHDLGGGVLLELSHEIDAAIWCFGPITEVTARLRHDGAPTDGRVETVADLAVTTQLGARGTIHLDMVREMPRRVWQASGPTGTIEADLLSGRVRGTGAAAEVDRQVPAGWRDRAEDRLVANLFAVDQGRAEPACSVDDGLAVLRVIDAARTSAQEGSGPVPVPVGPDRAPRSSAAPDGALR
jgi:predicted dehydrogenase